MYVALRATSESLVRFLDNEFARRGLMSPAVSLATPKEMAKEGVSLWLYRVIRDESRLNDPPLRPDPDHLRRASLPLRLHYLATPRAGTPEREQELLGAVLQSFHDHPVLSGADLGGAYARSDVRLTVRLEQLGMDQMSLAWDALQTDYQLSVSYEVSVVEIESMVLPSPAPVRIVMPGTEVMVGG